MPAPNPEHLLDQATRLATPPAAGAPRQTDIRRAISAAYYAAFHATLAAVADIHIGANARSTPRYALAYRSVDHRALRGVCDDVIKPTPPAKYRPYLPMGGFAGDLVQYAAALSDLQEKRYAADYDPVERFKLSDAQAAIRTARLAILRISTTPPDQLRAFVALLSFPPRGG